ncbi:MAG: glycine cleavage system aminomethyltransferase GcvT [Planctomycetaceae bacterium]
MHRTPLHDWHTAHSGRMADFAGWEMPIQYTSIIEEHHAVRQRVGMFDISHMGRLKFTGTDACALLDRIVTNDVARLEAGQVRYALVCNESGGILDDVLVYRFNDCYRLVVNASNREKVSAWISAHSADADAAMTDETFETCMIAVQGPQAVSLMQSLTAADLNSLNYFTVIASRVHDVPAIVSRTGYTGEDGFEIVVDAAAGPGVWGAVMDAGRDLEIRPCGLGARDTLRLEAAMPLYGHELDESTDPLTAGLAFGVKLNTGDFIGKDALQRIWQTPTGQMRIGLRLEGRRIAREGSPIHSGDRIIGRVTSGTYSPTLEQSIAMGYVPADQAAVGTALQIDLRGKREPAVVVPLPFYKRPSR